MTNTFSAELAALLPAHEWLLDEAAGAYADIGVTGGLALSEQTAGTNWRLAPGPIRGTPREFGFWATQSTGNRLQRTAAGIPATGWNMGGMGVVIQVDDLSVATSYLFTQTYANNSGLFVGLRITSAGVVEFICDGNGPINSGFSAAGVVAEGNRYLICGIQRGDAAGIRITVDGVDVTAGQTMSGGAVADDFCGSLLAGFDPGTDLLLNGLNLGTGVNNMVYARPFVFVNNPPSDAALLSLTASASLDGAPSDYHETVIDLFTPLRYWLTGWINTTAFKAITLGEGIGGGNTFTDAGFQTAPSLENVIDTAIISDFDDYFNAYASNDPAFTDASAGGTQVGAGDVVGTVNLIVEITNAAIGLTKHFLGYGDGVGADNFLVSILGSASGYKWLLRMEANSGDFFEAVGDTFFPTLPNFTMFTIVQDGTGFLFFIDGQPETFGVTSSGVSIDATSWLATIFATAAGPSVTLGGLPGSQTVNPPRGLNEIHQMQLSRQVLSAAEVAELFDAVNDIFPAPPSALGNFGTLLELTGNGALPEGPGPDWWWRMNVAAGVILDVGIAQNRGVSPINADAIVEGGNPLHQVTGPLPLDPTNAAIYFDGSGDYFEIGVNGVAGQLVNVSTGTIGGFFSRNAVEDENIIYAQSNDAGTAFWRLALNGINFELIVQSSVGNRVTLTSQPTFRGNDFRFYVLTCDGSVYRLFLDGKEDFLFTIVTLGTGAEGDWFDAVVADNSAIASRADAGFFTETTGRISEPFIYDGLVLSSSVIADLNQAAVEDGLTGVANPAGLLVFENVTFRNGALADIRAENSNANFQQVVLGNRLKFLGGQQGDGFTEPQCVLLKGPARAQFRGCHADLQATPVFGRGGIVGTAIDTSLAATVDGSILVSDCDFDQMGLLDGASFLSPVMCQAAFGMTVEESRFRDCLGTAVGWNADAQRVAVLKNQIEGTTQALGAIYSAQGLNTRLGSGWIIRGNKAIDTDGSAINLNGATSVITNFARNIAIQNNETDNNLTGSSIRVNQVGDVLIEDNKGNRSTFGVELGSIEASIVIRRNQMDEASLAAYITNDTATLQLADLTIDRNTADGNVVGDGILVTQVRRAVITNNKLLSMDDGVVIGDLAFEGVFAGNEVEALVPFAILPATTQVGFKVGRNFLTDLGNATSITVGTDTIEVIANYHSITSAGAIDLDTIDGPLVDGFLLVLRREIFSSDITLRDGIDNLNLGSDFLMDVDNDQIWLVRDGASWNQLQRVEAL